MKFEYDKNLSNDFLLVNIKSILSLSLILVCYLLCWLISDGVVVRVILFFGLMVVGYNLGAKTWTCIWVLKSKKVYENGSIIYKDGKLYIKTNNSVYIMSDIVWVKSFIGSYCLVGKVQVCRKGISVEVDSYCDITIPKVYKGFDSLFESMRGCLER